VEYLQFSSLSEEDFDEIINNTGGRRYTEDPKIKELNCDYVLGDAVIELKIIEEEPMGKKEKQKKLIELFPPNADTVVLYPNDEQKNKYYRILESPIQKALKKASKQLQVSAKNLNAKVRIAIIMNNGLYMISKNEFQDIAIRKAKNDTSGIDILIISSMYYFSDKFDMRIMFEFKDIEINNINHKNKKEIIKKLRKSWNKKTVQYMTENLTNSNLNRNKKPIQDLFFESDGIRYVKPPSQWGKASEFWRNGRPREDSAKNKNQPLIVILPIFNNESYLYAKKYLTDKSIWQNSLSEYIEFVENNPLESQSVISLTVYITLSKNDLQSIQKPMSTYDIQQYANLKYEALFDEIKNNMIEYSDKVKDEKFILVETQEIGIDQANDVSYISYIEGNSKQDFLIDGKHIKYEQAISLAIACCIITNAEKVYYIRNEDFKWK